MIQEFINEFVPAGVEGKQNELSHAKTHESAEDAHKTFERATKRLLNPDVWHELEGALSPVVALVDADGNELHRLAEAGDHYRIKLPALGNAEGDGYDWVKVEAIKELHDINDGEAVFGLRLRATANPEGSGDTAHFFAETATSNFIVHLQGTTVTAYYFGRNEVPNAATDSVGDNIRNAVVAAAAFIGMSEVQWNRLLHALLEEEIGG